MFVRGGFRSGFGWNLSELLCLVYMVVIASCLFGAIRCGWVCGFQLGGFC